MTRLVKEPFVPETDKMVLINRLDICRDFFSPSRDCRRCASAGISPDYQEQDSQKEIKKVAKVDSPCASLAARLVGKFPSQNGWFIHIASNKRFDVVLECSLDRRVGVEKIVVLGSENLADVDVHTSVVRPIVRAIKGLASVLAPTEETYRATINLMPLALAAATTLSSTR